MNIIEKLGIRRLEPFSSLDADGNIKYRFNNVSKMQLEWFYMLDALIEDTESLDYRMGHGSFSYMDEERMHKNIDIIQKATGKSWEEVKALCQS